MKSDNSPNVDKYKAINQHVIKDKTKIKDTKEELSPLIHFNHFRAKSLGKFLHKKS